MSQITTSAQAMSPSPMSVWVFTSRPKAVPTGSTGISIAVMCSRHLPYRVISEIHARKRTLVTSVQQLCVMVALQ